MRDLRGSKVAFPLSNDGLTKLAPKFPPTWS